MNRRHRILNRRIVLSNSRYDVLFDHVVGPDERSVSDFLMVRPKVRHSDTVAGVCVLPVVDDQIGLMLVHRPHFPEPLLVAPSGFIEPGESTETSALRELEEETGLVATSAALQPLGLLLLDPGVLEARVALYAAIVDPTPTAFESPASDALELGAGRLVLHSPADAERLALTSPNMDGATVAACLRWMALSRQIRR